MSNVEMEEKQEIFTTSSIHLNLFHSSQEGQLKWACKEE